MPNIKITNGTIKTRMFLRKMSLEVVSTKYSQSL